MCLWEELVVIIWLIFMHDRVTAIKAFADHAHVLQLNFLHFWSLIKFLVHLNLNLFVFYKINTLEIHQCPERVGSTDELFSLSEPYFWMNTFLPLKM